MQQLVHCLALPPDALFLTLGAHYLRHLREVKQRLALSGLGSAVDTVDLSSMWVGRCEHTQLLAQDGSEHG